MNGSVMINQIFGRTLSYSKEIIVFCKKNGQNFVKPLLMVYELIDNFQKVSDGS